MVSFKYKPAQYNLASNLQSLFTGNSFSDVTLVSDDQIPFRAHKCVIGYFIPEIKELLLNTNHSHPTIYLNGLKHQELESILMFMYLGKIQFDVDRIEELRTSVEKLKINLFSKALKKMMGEKEGRKIEVDNKNDVTVAIDKKQKNRRKEISQNHDLKDCYRNYYWPKKCHYT